VIVSSGLILMPTSVDFDAEHDALFDEDVISRPLEAANAEAENVSAPDINEISPNLASRTERAPSAGFSHIARSVIKPLVALLTAQYVIVAALVAGAAVTVAHHASHLINEKFAAIVTALKRL